MANSKPEWKSSSIEIYKFDDFSQSPWYGTEQFEDGSLELWMEVRIYDYQPGMEGEFFALGRAYGIEPVREGYKSMYSWVIRNPCEKLKFEFKMRFG